MTKRGVFSRRRRAMTLVELAVSIGIATLVMGGLASALVIASRATGLADSPAARTVESRSVIDRIAADVNHSMAFTEQTENALAFTVPDRDGDQAAETIRYAWSGTSGDPLTREYNGGTALPVAQDVRSFDLTYLARPNLFVETPLRTTGELELMTTDAVYWEDVKSYEVKSDRWCAQYIKPALPTNVTSWSVARIWLVMRVVYGSSTFQLEIRTADARQQPTDQILSQISAQGYQLPYDYAWVQCVFSGASNLDPLAGVCLVVKQTSGLAALRIQYAENGQAMPRNTHWLTSTNQGASWTVPVNNRDMYFDVHGTITTEGTTQW